MRKALAWAICTVSVFIATQASAQNWSFKYAGASIGKSWSNVDWVDNLGSGGVANGFFTPSPGSTYEIDDSQASFGVQFGQMFQQGGNIVVGYEIGLTQVGHSTDEVSPYYFLDGDRFETTIGASLSATGRLGYAVGNFLPYAEMGLAYGNVGMRNYTQGNIFCPTTCELDMGGWQPGFIFGLGVDYRVNDKFMIGISARRTQFNSVNYAGRTSQVNSTENYDIGAMFDTVMIRGNIIFD